MKKQLAQLKTLGTIVESGALTPDSLQWCLIESGDRRLLFTVGLSEQADLRQELVLEFDQSSMKAGQNWQHRILRLAAVEVTNGKEPLQKPHLWRFPGEDFHDHIVSKQGTVDVLALETPVGLPAKLSIDDQEFAVIPIVVLMKDETELFLAQDSRLEFLEGLRRGNRYRSGLSRAGFVDPYDKKCWAKLFKAQDAVAEQPDQPKRHFDLAQAHSGLADSAQTVKCFLKVLEMDPGYPKIYAAIADAMYQDAGYEERSLPYFRKALELEPERSSLHWGYVSNLCRLERFREVKEHLLKTAREFEKLAHLPQDIGEHFLSREIWKAAETCLQTGLELNSEDKNIARKLASALGKQQKYEALIPVLKDSAEKPFEFYNLAIAYRFCHQPDKEIEAYRRALKVSPGHRLASLNLGHCLRTKGLHNEAIEIYQCSLERYPDHPTLLDSLGFLHLTLGELDKAQDCLEKSLEQDKNATAMLNLGHVFLCSKRNEKAKETYAKGRALLPAGQDFVALMTPDYDDALHPFVEKGEYLGVLAQVVENS